jgi:hypothetical protein
MNSTSGRSASSAQPISETPFVPDQLDALLAKVTKSLQLAIYVNRVCRSVRLAVLGKAETGEAEAK